MRSIDLEIGQVRYRDVAVPTRFRERFRGLRATTGPMLFEATNSVHGFGLDRPLTVVAIAADRRVLAVRTLRPGAVLYRRRAASMLELEAGDEIPAVGDRVTTYDPADGWTAGGVRNSDRESRRHFRASRPNSR